MFNKSLEVQRKAEREYAKVYSRGEDVGDCSTSMVFYHGRGYKVKPIWKLVVDSYDADIASIELSHRQSLGYSIVYDYYDNNYYDKNDCTLDFRFVRVQDNIEMKIKDNINRIFLNSANIRYAIFNSDQALEYDITIDSDFIDFMISLKQFLKVNKSTIDSIHFQGVNNMAMAKMIEMICASFDIYNISFSNNINRVEEHEIDKTYKKR